MKKCPVPPEVYRIIGAPSHDCVGAGWEWQGGCYRFRDLPYDDLERIEKIMGESLNILKGCGFPTVREFLEKSRPHREVTTFHGYIISPTREDERLTINSITTAQTKEIMRWVSSARYIDERGPLVWAGWK